MVGGKDDVRVCAGKGPSHDSTRGPESSGRPRGEKEGVRWGGAEKGAVAMATPPIRPDFQRGRKNFKSQPSALEQLLLKGVHTAPPPPSARGQSWVPPPLGRRPRRPSPPAGSPATPAPRAPGGRPGPSPQELGRVGRPGPRLREGGVCTPGGGADQPAFLPPALPAGSPPPGGRPTGPLLAPRQGGRRAARGAAEFRGERERAVS